MNTLTDTNIKITYAGIDYFRMVAAFLIIAIHTAPLSSYNETADFLFTYCFSRIAVPFFLMTTGYFVLAPYIERNRIKNRISNTKIHHNSAKKEKLHYRKHIVKMIMIYLSATLLFLPISLYAGQFSLNPLDLMKKFVFDGTFYHLWYLPASILGCIMVILLTKKIGIKKALIISCIAYLIGLFGDSYYELLKQVKPIHTFYEFLFSFSSYTRNGIFYAPVFLVMGACMGRKALGDKNSPTEQEGNRKNYCIGFVISLFLMLIEGYLTFQFELQRHNSMYLFLIPCMYFLFQILLEIPGKAPAAASLRKISLWIYLLHPLLIIAVRGIGKLTGLTGLLVDNSLVHYLSVCISTLAVSMLVTLITGFVHEIRSQKTRRKIQQNQCLSITENKADTVLSDKSANHTMDWYETGRAWIELSVNNLKHNVNLLQSLLPQGCTLMPAVKANAYGHGAALIAKSLQDMGITDFCTASVSEGIELRDSGINGEILVLGYTHPKQFEKLITYSLTQTVIDLEYARTLQNYGKPIKVHIAVDTGMRRLGERSEHIENILDIFSYQNLTITGLYSHLCVADSSNPSDVEFTIKQISEFQRVIELLHANGVSGLKYHLQNSYGFLNYPQLQFDYVRPGIALYGLLSVGSDKTNTQIVLRPVLSLKSRVECIKILHQGESAGYGLDYTTTTEKRIAVISVGYADGLPRSLSNRGNALIHGHRVPIIGRICMDQMLLDVTEVPHVQTGDVAILIGKSFHEEISANEIAAITGTISNEILSRLGQRLERILV